jgi:hypothetical protein
MRNHPKAAKSGVGAGGGRPQPHAGGGGEQLDVSVRQHSAIASTVHRLWGRSLLAAGVVWPAGPAALVAGGWPGWRRGPWTAAWALGCASRAAELPRIRLHDVRHGYATAALAAGVPPKVISQRLGHATIAITMDTYSHVIPGLDEQAAETVARLILGDGEVIADLSVNKPLATAPRTDDTRREVKRSSPAQRGVGGGT